MVKKMKNSEIYDCLTNYDNPENYLEWDIKKWIEYISDMRKTMLKSSLTTEELAKACYKYVQRCC